MYVWGSLCMDVARMCLHFEHMRAHMISNKAIFGECIICLGNDCLHETCDMTHGHNVCPFFWGQLAGMLLLFQECQVCPAERLFGQGLLPLLVIKFCMSHIFVPFCLYNPPRRDFAVTCGVVYCGHMFAIFVCLFEESVGPRLRLPLMALLCLLSTENPNKMPMMWGLWWNVLGL